jgi:putative RecB family exonuclease
MDISELRKQPHLSASSIGSYMDCGLSYKFGRIDKIPPEFKSDSQIFGIVLHKTLACFYIERKIGIAMTLKEIHEAFEEFWSMDAKEREDIKYTEGKNYESYLVEGRDLLSVWYDKLPKESFKVIGVEEGFAFYIPGLDIPIVGYIDLIEEDATSLIITDFKTTGRNYGDDEIDKNNQITLYQMACKSNGYADREILLKLDLLIKTKTPKFESYYTTRSKNEEQRLIKKIQHVWDGINKGVFLPNDTSWKCSGCQFQKACEKWFQEGGN